MTRLIQKLMHDNEIVILGTYECLEYCEGKTSRENSTKMWIEPQKNLQ